MVTRIKGTQSRSVETRTGILLAVERLWQNRPFDSITIADIAAEAGVAKGSVLAHFSEKLSILASFLADYLDETSQSLAEKPGFARNAQTLVGAIEPLLGHLLADKALLRLLTTEGDGVQCRAILDPAVLRLTQALEQGFDEAGFGDSVLCADVFIALVVQVVVAGYVSDVSGARDALTRLAGIIYRH